MHVLQLLLAASLTQTTAPASPTIPDSLDFRIVRAIPVQHDGRWMPLDTLARDMVDSVTGTPRWQRHDPVALLLAWTFDSARWMQQPLIEIGNAELRRELQLPADQTVFSYEMLLRHQRLRQLMDDLAMVQGRKLDPLESKVRDIRERLTWLDTILAGQAIHLIPHPSDPLGAWKPIELTPGAKAAGGSPEEAWLSVGGAFLRGDDRAFAQACEKLRSVLEGLPAAYRPSPDLIATELRSNRLHPLGMSWKIMLVGAICGLLALILRNRVMDVLTIAALAAGFAVLSYGMWLRWQIAGRIPASNMFESLLFMGWGATAFALLTMMIAVVKESPSPSSSGASLFAFKGRIRRMEYWYTTLTASLIGDLLHLMLAEDLLGVCHDASANAVTISACMTLYLLLLLPLFWVSLAAQVKRWHDRGKSGWMALVMMIPVIGWIWAIVELGFLRGTTGPNAYGDDPLGPARVLTPPSDEAPTSSEMRIRAAFVTASVIGALTLFLADKLPLDQYIRPTPPVLMDTIWMSIHVPVIMVSYAVLAIAFLIAHGQMFVMAATPERSQLVKTIDRLHYLYVLAGAFLLLIGIATGSMWAASSWGRYWGWDPKEVWSLIALLAYLTILHVRVSREKTPAWMYVFALLLGAAVFGIVGARLAPLTMMRWLGLGSAAAAVVVCALVRGPLGDAVKSILAFWLIIMTYVGVNFVLGTGLHSYGFGTGAVVHYLFLFGTIDLILVLVCVGVYYLRYNPGPACARVANRLH